MTAGQAPQPVGPAPAASGGGWPPTPAQLFEYGYRYGVALLFSVVLLMAVLLWGHRLDERSQENAIDLAQVDQRLTLAEQRDARILTILDAQNQELTRLSAQLAAHVQQGGGG